MGSIVASPVSTGLRECARCFLSADARVLVRHHRNGQVRDNRPENLQSLCYPCHRAVHDAEGLRADPPYARQESWKRRQGDAWRAKRAAYMRAWRKAR